MTIVLPIDDADRRNDATESYVSVADKREHSAAYHAIVARLNDRWRVIDSCERHPYRQWILQYRGSDEVTSQRAWKGSSFCQIRIVLLRCIREKAGEVDAAALAIVEQLPDRIL